MTPSILLKLPPESTTKRIGMLSGFYYNHIPEVEHDAWIHVEQTRVEIRFYKNHCFDGRRVWILASVWFDGEPVMIIQNAGREGDDHARRFILDETKYKNMVAFISSLGTPSILGTPSMRPESFSDVVCLEQDLPLTSFYGFSLDSDFDREIM